MYELFILGQLMDHSMTGYQLRKALVNVVGQELTISFGALYPLLDKLAGAHVLTQGFKPTTSKRPQKLATITTAGRQRFKDLVLTPVSLNKQTQLTFQMKINFLHLLTAPEKVTVLQDFQKFAAGQLERLVAQVNHVRDNPNMVAEDIQDALLVNELQRVRAQAQLTWVTNLIQTMERES